MNFQLEGDTIAFEVVAEKDGIKRDATVRLDGGNGKSPDPTVLRGLLHNAPRSQRLRAAHCNRSRSI